MTVKMTYEQAAETLGSRTSRKIGNNTYLHRIDADTIGLRLHATDVVTFRPGTITLDSGGWRTVTTKDRLNYALDVFAKAGTWYVGAWRDDMPITYPYHDGITFTEDGELVGEPIVADVAEAAAMKRRITAYAKLCTDTLAAGMPSPSGGDCWYCLMHAEDGTSLGDLGDHEHLLAHMDEGYVVPSLLLNAVVEKGYRSPGFILGAKEDGTMGGRQAADRIVRGAVRDYMKRRLLPTQTGARPVGVRA